MTKATIDVYTDGSYSPLKDGVGWGLTMSYTGERFNPLYELNGVIKEPTYVALRNVAGELISAMQGIKFAEATGIRVRIHYDYQGVEKWVTGEWRAKNNVTQTYAHVAKEIYNKGLVEFIKVPAHSGDPGNERADYLAKVALDGIVVNTNNIGKN